MICKNCGAKLTDTARFCTRCGTPQNFKEGYPKKKKKVLIIILIIVCVLFVSVAGVLIWKLIGNKNNSKKKYNTEETIENIKEITAYNTFYLENKLISMPIELETLLDMGFVFEISVDEKIPVNNRTIQTNMYNNDGDYLGYVFIKNYKDYDIPAADGIVTFFCCDTDVDLIFYGNTSKSSSLNDVFRKCGKPKYHGYSYIDYDGNLRIYYIPYEREFEEQNTINKYHDMPLSYVWCDGDNYRNYIYDSIIKNTIVVNNYTEITFNDDNSIGKISFNYEPEIFVSSEPETETEAETETEQWTEDLRSKYKGINFVENPGFEDSDFSMWRCTDYLMNEKALVYNTEDPYGVIDWVEDCYEGNYTFHFWSEYDDTFEVSQNISQGKLVDGQYYASVQIQGDEVGENAVIYLFVKVNDKLYKTGNVQLSGYQDWKKLTISSIPVESDDVVTIGVHVEHISGGWGTIDNFDFELQ